MNISRTTLIATIAVAFATAGLAQPVPESSKERQESRAAVNRRPSAEELQRQIQQLERDIEESTNRFHLGTDVIATWEKAFNEIMNAARRLAAQEESCKTLKGNLQKVIDDGDIPSNWLAQSQRRVNECNDRSATMRSYFESIRAEMEAMKVDVDRIAKIVPLEGATITEQRNAKQGLEQLLSLKISEVRKKIDGFKSTNQPSAAGY